MWTAFFLREVGDVPAIEIRLAPGQEMRFRYIDIANDLPSLSMNYAKLQNLISDRGGRYKLVHPMTRAEVEYEVLSAEAKLIAKTSLRRSDAEDERQLCILRFDLAGRVVLAYAWLGASDLCNISEDGGIVGPLSLRSTEFKRLLEDPGPLRNIEILETGVDELTVRAIGPASPFQPLKIRIRPGYDAFADYVPSSDSKPGSSPK